MYYHILCDASRSPQARALQLEVVDLAKKLLHADARTQAAKANAEWRAAQDAQSRRVAELCFIVLSANMRGCDGVHGGGACGRWCRAGATGGSAWTGTLLMHALVGCLDFAEQAHAVSTASLQQACARARWRREAEHAELLRSSDAKCKAAIASAERRDQELVGQGSGLRGRGVPVLIADTSTLLQNSACAIHACAWPCMWLLRHVPVHTSRRGTGRDAGVGMAL